jgi:hypothetical protein
MVLSFIPLKDDQKFPDPLSITANLTTLLNPTCGTKDKTLYVSEGIIMKLFVFSSKNLTNIWAGIGAHMWAVPQGDASWMKAIKTRSKSMMVGSCGILYCSETQSLTTPFLVYSIVGTEKTIKNVWPESWQLPFSILPLGTPNKQLHKDDAFEKLSILKDSGKSNITQILNIPTMMVFNPNEILEEDWATIIGNLAE